MSADFHAGRRRTLAALADVLIPADELAPAASQIGVAGALLDRVLDARPDLAEPLANLLDNVEDEVPAEAVARLFSEDRASFRGLTTVVSGAYYLDVERRSAVGYPGTRPLPLLSEEESNDAVGDGLLDPVLERGSLFRTTSG
jgi:hypothetical protein